MPGEQSSAPGGFGWRAALRLSVVVAGLTVLALAALSYAAPGSMLQTGQQLLGGRFLISPNRQYTLAMQSGGNLVEYMGSRALWASRTTGNPGARAVMQSDGNLVVRSAGGAPLWASNTGGHKAAAYHLAMQSDGNLVVYRAGRVVWANGANRRARSKPSTGGYPYAAMPCIWAPYAIDGKGYWCSGYNWGRIHNNARPASEQSPYGYEYRNCTDFVAWKLARLGVSPGRYWGLGNAKTWGKRARAHGVRNDATRAVGAVAVRTSGPYGHVAFITRVAGGRITVAQYDRAGDGAYTTQTGTPRALGFTSFDHFEVYER